jgi:hypothetical protein
MAPEPVPATWFQEESMLGSASWPTRPMPAFGPALVCPSLVGTVSDPW